MIVTLTLNPSLDLTVSLGEPLEPGTVHRARAVREDAGGKGINVARAIARAGRSALAVLPLAPRDPFSAALNASGLAARTVPVAHDARSNITIAAPDGTTTKLNLPGAALTGAQFEAIREAVVDAAEGADWLVLAGSLPPGAGERSYADIIAAVRGRWRDRSPLIAVDTSGPALNAVLEGARPDLIKPNDEELAELVGVSADAEIGPAEARELALRLVPDRVGAVLVTLGARGAVLVTADGAWTAPVPPTRVRSTVGAGDASLSGYLLAALEGAPEPDRLVRAVKYGSAAASLDGTLAPAPSDLSSAPLRAHPLPRRD